MKERILIVRLAALGDIVMTSVLLSRIRVERPDAEVTWLCAASMRPLVELFPGVHRIIVVDEQKLFRGNGIDQMREVARVWGRLGKTKFDQMMKPASWEEILQLELLVREATRLIPKQELQSGPGIPIPGLEPMPAPERMPLPVQPPKQMPKS